MDILLQNLHSKRRKQQVDLSMGRLLGAQIFFDAYGTQNIIYLPHKPQNFKENDLRSIPALRTKHL